MRLTLPSILLAAITVAACAKKPEKTQAPPVESKPVQLQVEPAADAGQPAPPTASPAAADSTPAATVAVPLNGGPIRAAIEKFFAEQGNFPHSWQEMINLKYLKSVPVGADGKPLDWNQYIQSLNR